VSDILLYDGVCGLCDRTVQFLLRRDRKGVLSFAPLQGTTAAAVRSRHPDVAKVDSMVFVRDAGTDGEQVFLRSTAVVQAVTMLGGAWRLASWLRIVPAPLRNTVYDAIAKRRYRWFGKFDSCRLPQPGQRERFLP
jgi:predicted DCC family thiol-disulfide oxidoreductase YuxK